MSHREYFFSSDLLAETICVVCTFTDFVLLSQYNRSLIGGPTPSYRTVWFPANGLLCPFSRV